MKGVGLDCIGVAQLVAEAAGHKFDYAPNYDRTGSLTRLLEVCNALFTVTDEPGPGDVSIYIMKGYTHVAVHTYDGKVVHAWAARTKNVMEQTETAFMRRHTVVSYRMR